MEQTEAVETIRLRDPRVSRKDKAMWAICFAGLGLVAGLWAGLYLATANIMAALG
jgi:hypothetical protein